MPGNRGGKKIRRMLAVLSVALLMLVAPSTASADDYNPNHTLTPEEKWQLKAGFAWDYYQRGVISNPCENDAFLDIYGEWFDC
jgi:hypothetical protein